MNLKNIILICCMCVNFSCSKNENIQLLLKDNVEFASKQFDLRIGEIEKRNKLINPVTLDRQGNLISCEYSDWRSGFFPGSLWYLYELSNNSKYLDWAKRYTNEIIEAKDITWSHDVGFIIGCSFGNGYRLEKDSLYKSVIIDAAKSLITRFKPQIGVLQSWDVSNGWQSKRGWECPVIIDNMMNLELLFLASKLSGDSIYYNIAVSHANRTLVDFFRSDGSCYHVVDYSLKDGSVRKKQTAQGYNNESIWSRGHAWAIYGYVACFRETRDSKYLTQAIKTFNMLKSHPDLPFDCIPYWDMSTPDIPNTPRDVSAAACIASALYELASFDCIKESNYYVNYADSIMRSLSSDAYRAKVGTNAYFLLLHSVGSVPHGAEIDVPLNYADYYFLEAIQRRERLLVGK